MFFLNSQEELEVLVQVLVLLLVFAEWLFLSLKFPVFASYPLYRLLPEPIHFLSLLFQHLSHSLLMIITELRSQTTKDFFLPLDVHLQSIGSQSLLVYFGRILLFGLLILHLSFRVQISLKGLLPGLLFSELFLYVLVILYDMLFFLSQIVFGSLYFIWDLFWLLLVP